MMQRWEPFSDLRAMQGAMDRIWRKMETERHGAAGSPEIEAWAIPLDVTQDGDSTIIRASMPGVSPDGIQVSVEDNLLTIRGETAKEYQTEGDGYLMRERRVGAFHRSLRLPESVDVDGVEPMYEHGILSIVIPKAETKRARQLKVQIPDSSAA